MSFLRSSRTAAISAPDLPSAASRDPIWASIPSPAEADRESTTWISRSGRMPAAMRAALSVADSWSETVTQTTDSAPPSKAASNAARKSPAEHAAVVGNGASGAVIRAQNSSVVMVTFGRKLSEPKLTTSGTTTIP